MTSMAHVRTDAREGVAVQARKPFGWGDDRLAAFLNVASDNVLGTFARLRDEYDRLRRIDDAFVDFTDNLLNPRDPIAPLLMLQAHASYRAAAELAMTCQSAPAFMAMRGCVESSLYGLYFHRNPNTFEVWARRHDSDAARQAVRAEFTIRRLKDCLAAVDAATANAVADLYDKSIDFGAHPNVAAPIRLDHARPKPTIAATCLEDFSCSTFALRTIGVSLSNAAGAASFAAQMAGAGDPAGT